MKKTQNELVALLLDVVRAAHAAMDNTEDDGEGLHWHRPDFDALSAAMDKLDELPDDRPGYVMGPAAKVEWALQQLAAAAPGAVPEGWKLVPIEPTKEMCKAAVVYANGEDVYQTVTPAVLDIEESIYGETYRAMIEASPITSEQGKWVCTYETTASGDSGGGRWVGDKEYWSDAPAIDTRADTGEQP